MRSSSSFHHAYLEEEMEDDITFFSASGGSHHGGGRPQQWEGGGYMVRGDVRPERSIDPFSLTHIHTYNQHNPTLCQHSFGASRPSAARWTAGCRSASR